MEINLHNLGFNDEIDGQLDHLMQKDSRIILGNFNESWARVVFCQAYKKGMYGPKFQWLIVGMYEEEWWLEPSTDCTPRQIQTALIGVMVMDIQALASREEITVSGRVCCIYGALRSTILPCEQFIWDTWKFSEISVHILQNTRNYQQNILKFSAVLTSAAK